MLELDDIHTHYGDSHILKGVSLSVHSEEVVGMLGRNGAGKTTTLRSITGIQPPSRGEIRFEGEDITDRSITEISRLGIKLVLEERRSFANLTVEENLLLSRDFRHGDDWTLEEVYDRFGLLADRSNQGADQLSGGEQQMLVIAQALLGNPKLILLDEPMEGLAPQIVQDVSDVIRSISKMGTPILVVEQNLHALMEVIDRGYLLHNGEICLRGSAETIANSPDKIQRYLGVSI
jgi:branched-chain amino acid transport system ATP-binding protein